MPDLLSPIPSPDAAPTRRVVVVLGMHRSGTSVVAGCLQRLGLDFGPRLMPPNPDNPRGYFEHNDVVNVHDRLLLALDRSWDDPTPFPPGWATNERLLPYREMILAILRRDFAASPLWGLKDPRLCRLLPWWESLWTETGCRPLFVLVRRAPAEIAASLARREGMSAAKAFLLYLRHTLEAEGATRSHARVIVDFADLLRDEHAALAPVRRALGLTEPIKAGGLNVVDPTLGRSIPPREIAALPAWVEAADGGLRAGIDGEETGLRATFDQISAGLQAAGPFLQCGSSDAGDLRQQLLASRKQARWYEEEWRKSQTKSDLLQRRLDKAIKPSLKHLEPEFSKLEDVSLLINSSISKLRKEDLSKLPPVSKFRRIWRILRGK